MFDNMKYINSLSFDKLEEMLAQMSNILIHNNKKAREFLEGEEPWRSVMREYVDGKAKTWKGTKGITAI